MRYISWFSGIGGFDIALTSLGHEPVAYSEIDPYAIRVYEKHFPGVPSLGDLHKITPSDIPASDMWCGGFPCQPFSCAGARKGSEDERHLWPVWSRLIAQIRPRVLLLENVPGLLTSEHGHTFSRILYDLAEAGYVVEWSVVGAYEVGAPHRRDRLWVVAHADQQEQPSLSINDGQGERVPRSTGDVVSDSDSSRPANISGEHPHAAPHRSAESFPDSWRKPYAAVLRVDDGIRPRVYGHRIRCLGNAVVPQVVRWIAERMEKR